MNYRTQEIFTRIPENMTIRIGIISSDYIPCYSKEMIPIKDIFSCLKNGDTRITDISIHFLFLLSQIDAFVKFVPFDSFGALNPSGSGMTDHLVNGLIDMAVYSMILTEERYSKSAMSIPTVFSPIEIYYRGNPAAGLPGPDLLFRPFQKFVWLSVFWTSLFFVLITAKYRNSAFLNAVAAGSSTMVCLAYSSNLKAILAGHVAKAPFEDIRGLAQSIEEGKYLLAMDFLDDYRMEMIRNADPFNELYPLKKALLKHPPIKVRTGAVLCDHLLNDNRTVVNNLGLATIELRVNIELYCGIRYR